MCWPGFTQAVVQAISEGSGADDDGSMAADSADQVAVGGDHGGRRRIIHVGNFLGDEVIGRVRAAARGVRQLNRTVSARGQVGNRCAVGDHQRRHARVAQVFDKADQRAAPIGPPAVGTTPDHVHGINHNHCG